METRAQKELFLRQEFIDGLRSINPNTAPLFGKMTPQQMVEHMAEYIRMGYGNPVVHQVFYTADSVEKLRSFIMSDKPFKDNTPNPLLSEVPKPVAFPDYESAIQDVVRAVDELISIFTARPLLEVASPFFGVLDYDMTLQLLTKHARHHLRQFGVL